MSSSYNPGGKAIGTPAITLTGTPSTGQAPIATSASAATWQDVSSGGTPGLPVWTYVSGGGDSTDPMPAGKWRATEGTIAGISQIQFSNASKNGDTQFNSLFTDIAIGSTLILTDSSGKSLLMKVISFQTGTATFIQLEVNMYGLGYPTGYTISGDYQLSLGVSTAAIKLSQSAAIQKGDGTGGFADATPGTDYLAPGALPNGTTAVTQSQGDDSTKVATTAFVLAEIASAFENSGALAQLLFAAGITPVVDGTVTPITSITTASGIPTAIS